MAIAPGHFSEGSRWKPTRWTHSCTISWIQILTFVQKSKVFFSSIPTWKPATACSSHSDFREQLHSNFQRKILQGYKLRLSEQCKLKFPDPRPFIQKHGLAPTPFPVPLMGKDGSVWKDPIFRGKQSHALNCKRNIHKHIRLLYCTVCHMSYSAAIWLLGPNFCSLASDRKHCAPVVMSLLLLFGNLCGSWDFVHQSYQTGLAEGGVRCGHAPRRSSAWVGQGQESFRGPGGECGGGPACLKFHRTKEWSGICGGYGSIKNWEMDWLAKAKSIWMNHISGILYLL